MLLRLKDLKCKKAHSAGLRHLRRLLQGISENKQKTTDHTLLLSPDQCLASTWPASIAAANANMDSTN